MSVDFTFLSNILSLFVGVFLFFKLKHNKKATFFSIFFLATGIASGLAAFGHLPQFPNDQNNLLLMASRALSHLALASFAAGCMAIDSRLNTGILRVSLLSIFVAMLVWLVADNRFLPVIFFGILSLVVFGLIAFIPYFKLNKKIALAVLAGIGCNILAAVVFKMEIPMGALLAVDVGHMLIALSLIMMYQGFRQLT